MQCPVHQIILPLRKEEEQKVQSCAARVDAQGRSATGAPRLSWPSSASHQARLGAISTTTPSPPPAEHTSHTSIAFTAGSGVNKHIPLRRSSHAKKRQTLPARPSPSRLEAMSAVRDVRPLMVFELCSTPPTGQRDELRWWLQPLLH